MIQYESAADAARARDAILAEISAVHTPVAVKGIGTQAFSADRTPDWDASDMLFVHCTTVVHITFTDSVSVVEDYAKQVEKRLSMYVC
jgi:hypothetical protein